MNGYQSNAKYMIRHVDGKAVLSRFLGCLFICALPTQAFSDGYLECMLPNNEVAISTDLDDEYARTCFSRHLDSVFGAKANYYSMDYANAKSNLESAKANVAIMPPENYGAVGFDLAIVVTAFGAPNDMALDSGDGFQELAMVSAMNEGSEIVSSHEMGEMKVIQALRDYNFAALSMAGDQAVQHFHVVGISCD